MPIVKVTFPDGTSYSNQSPDDVTDPNETGLADGGHDPGLLELITKLLEHEVTLIQSIGGLGAAVGYTFSTATADADPGAGTIRLNGATNVATEIYVDLTGADGQDVTALLDTFDDSTSPAKGYLALRQADDSSKWAIYRVTGVTAVAGYRKLAVVPLAPVGAVAFADGAALSLSFNQTGDKGEVGDVGNILAQPVAGPPAMGDWILLHSLAAGATRRMTLADLLGSTAITSMTVTTFTATTATVTDLTVSGESSLQGPAELTETETQWEVTHAATGTIQWRYDDPDVAYFKLTGDTTIDFMGPWKPGNLRSGLTAMIVQGGAGGYDLTLQLGSRITNANDLGTDAIDSYHARYLVTPTELVAPALDEKSPTTRSWSIAASGGNDVHLISARRSPVSAAPWEYVYAALVKAGTTSRGRVVAVADTTAKGGHADFDLSTGTIVATGNDGAGTHVASGIVALTGRWAGWFVPWVAANVGTDGGVDVIGRLYLADAAGNTAFAPAGETLLFGGDVLYAGSTYMGFPMVAGASRLPTWLGPGEPPWTAQAGGTQSALQLLFWPNGTFWAADIKGS